MSCHVCLSRCRHVRALRIPSSEPGEQRGTTDGEGERSYASVCVAPHAPGSLRRTDAQSPWRLVALLVGSRHQSDHYHNQTCTRTYGHRVCWFSEQCMRLANSEPHQAPGTSHQVSRATDRLLQLRQIPMIWLSWGASWGAAPVRIYR